MNTTTSGIVVRGLRLIDSHGVKWCILLQSHRTSFGTHDTTNSYGFWSARR